MIRSADGFRIPLASSGGPLVLLLELTKFVMERIGLAEHYNETDHGENVFHAGFLCWVYGWLRAERVLAK